MSFGLIYYITSAIFSPIVLICLQTFCHIQNIFEKISLIWANNDHDVCSWNAPIYPNHNYVTYELN